MITAFWQLRKDEASRPKEPPFPDERIARAVGVLQRHVPVRLDQLRGEIAAMPQEMHPARVREIARLRRVLAAVSEKPHLPLDKDYEEPVTAEMLVSALNVFYDQIYGPSKAWAGSPKVQFIAAAVHRAGWRNKTPAAIEQQLLRRRRRSTTKA
jgi:hypothetical protein